MIVKKGIPEEIIPEVAAKHQVAKVYFSEEATAEEKSVERRVASRLKKINVEIETHWQATLYHPEDLPFPVSQIPDLFTNFRKEVEKKSS